MRGYVKLADGFHKVIDFYSLKSDGYHRWLNWGVEEKTDDEVIIYVYELPTIEGSVRFEVYYRTSDPTDTNGNIIYTARIIGTGTPDPNVSFGSTDMADKVSEAGITVSLVKHLKVWDGVKPYAYSRLFMDFANAEDVAIADSCTSFGKYSFYGDTALVTARLGAGTTDIRDCAFKNCSALANINFPDTLQSIDYSAFSGCSSLETVDMSGCAIDTLGQYCFAYCTALKNVSFPSDGLLQIPDYGFIGCTALQNIVIPNTITHILQYAFCNCTSLPSIAIPDSVEYIRQYAFLGCSAMTTVTFGSGVKDIQQYAFARTGIVTLKTPAALEKLGRCVFRECNQLTHADLSDSVIQNIQTQLFYGCTALTECLLPNTVKMLGTEAFSGCSALSSITIPANVTLIYSSAFRDCSALALVDMTACSSDITIYSDAFTTIAQNSVITVSSAELKAYIENPDNGIINADGRTTVELV